MKTIAIIWLSMQGYKTIAASIYWGTVMPGALVMFPEGVPTDVNKWLVIVGFFLTSVGLGDKWYRRAREQADK